ncbi:MAG TPA: SdrD B-like domain-containing protein [Rhodopila sp.]|nr:SdrD B-like domain-containing protein [Rhodopila sp.]
MSLTFNPLTYGNLSFTNISVTETDVGSTAPFVTTPGILVGLSTINGPAMAWEGINAGVYYANSSEVLNIDYTVTAASGSLISSAGQLYTADYLSGPGVHLTAVENIYSTDGTLLATETYTQGAVNQAYVPLSQNVQAINVQITVTMSIDSTGTAQSALLISNVQQTYDTVVAPPSTASIGDIVFFDSTGSGLESSFDSGPGVPGVTVELLNGTGTSVLAVTTTNASGLYSFTGLAAGVYEVEFVSPNGYSFTTQGVGGNPAINSSANQTTGITAPITLTAGQADHNVEAGLVASGGSGAGGSATLGEIVWLDTNHDGILDNGEKGVAGVTVELLNGAGTSILATTTTNSTGYYQFTNLAPGSYDVQFVTPSGYAYTTQNVSTSGINSVADSTGHTAPVTLTAGQVDDNVNAGLVQDSGISVLKVPCDVVVNQCGQETYTFYVTNTGSTALANIKIVDNIGTAANPDYVTPTLVTQDPDGILQAGQTWVYTETINQIGCTSLKSGSVCHTATGSHLSSGSTAWLSSNFNPTSCANGATYKFQGITCTIQGSGTGGRAVNVTCPDSVITFSSSCKQATTVYDSNTNCWVTTLPANSNPGSVFLSGCPTTIPGGYNFSNCSVTWNIGDASNNCGASSISWDGSCTGYSSFNQNGCNGLSDYNQIGVKSCDNLSGYGSGGNCNVGYGWDGSSYCDTGYNGCGGGFGYNYNNCGWQGSSSDNCGTPENQYCGSSCGNTSNCNSGGSSCDGQNNYWGCGGSSGSSCGGDSGSSCGGSGSATQNCGTGGAADTVTVTAQTVVAGKTTSATVTASDTKEVEILANNSNVSVDGTTPTGSLSTLYGAAETLEFVYNPGNSVSLVQNQSGMASLSGSNSLNTAYMVIENASGSSIYFEGLVTAGELIFADAALNPLTNTVITNGQFSTKAGAGIVAQVYTSQAVFQAGAAPIQTMNYNTSGSQAMHLGDTVGSLELEGYVGTKGGHVVDQVSSGNGSSGNGANTDTVTLNLSEDAYQGDAQFTVSVDGHQVGGVMTASALHSSGDSNVFVLTGNWGSGAQQVSISFINDCYNGTANTDRNLYVSSIAYDGKTYAGTSASMLSNGTDTFTVGGNTASAAAPADTLTLFLSEDAYQGNAQFELFIDGKQVTTAQSVTALHGSGQSQAFTFSGNFGAGNHTVGVAFLNDCYNGTASTDRNLYVNSISLNGATVSGSTASLLSSGTTNFSIYTAH